MFGFGKKKEVTVEKEEAVKEYINVYRIRGIHLTDGYDQKIYVREYGERDENNEIRYFKKTKNNNPNKIRIYILYEDENNRMGFNYGTWEYVDSRWVADDVISKIIFYDGPSKIVYQCTDYCITKSDGSKEYITKSVLREILVNRNGNMPIM